MTLPSNAYGRSSTHIQHSIVSIIPKSIPITYLHLVVTRAKVCLVVIDITMKEPNFSKQALANSF